MRHSDDSRPPSASGAGSAAATRDLTLTSDDGTSVPAFEARAAESTGAGIVVLPDVRGLHQFYKDLAVRFAEVGVDAVAIDYFGRTAKTPDRTDAFEFRPHVQQTTPEGVAADVAAAVAQLRSDGATKVFTVGFCFGGGYSWRQSADTPGLAGCIGFYGRRQPALEVADRMQAPLLMLVAGRRAHPGRGHPRGQGGGERRGRLRGLRGRPALVLRPDCGRARRCRRTGLDPHPALRARARLTAP